MVVVEWFQALARHGSRTLGQAGRHVPHSDPGRQVITERLGASDSYWWILTGGIRVPGFGAYVESSNDS